MCVCLCSIPRFKRVTPPWDGQHHHTMCEVTVNQMNKICGPHTHTHKVHTWWTADHRMVRKKFVRVWLCAVLRRRWYQSINYYVWVSSQCANHLFKYWNSLVKFWREKPSSRVTMSVHHTILPELPKSKPYFVTQRWDWLGEKSRKNPPLKTPKNPLIQMPNTHGEWDGVPCMHAFN